MRITEGSGNQTILELDAKYNVCASSNKLGARQTCRASRMRRRDRREGICVYIIIHTTNNTTDKGNIYIQCQMQLFCSINARIACI